MFYVCKKVSRKITFFVACAKKTKNYVVKRYLKAHKFFFFIKKKQKDFFSQNFVPRTHICEHVCVKFSFEFF